MDTKHFGIYLAKCQRGTNVDHEPGHSISSSRYSRPQSVRNASCAWVTMPFIPLYQARKSERCFHVRWYAVRKWQRHRFLYIRSWLVVRPNVGSPWCMFEDLTVFKCSTYACLRSQDNSHKSHSMEVLNYQLVISNTPVRSQISSESGSFRKQH